MLLESFFKNIEAFAFSPVMYTSIFQTNQVSFSKENVFMSKSYYITRTIIAWKASNKEEEEC